MSSEALRELNAAMKDAFGAMKGSISGIETKVVEIRERVQDLEQRGAHRFSGSASNLDGFGKLDELTELVLKSEGLALYKNGNSPKVEIRVPRAMFSGAMMAAATTTDTQSTTGTTGSLVRPDRRTDIAAAPLRRFTVRDLFTMVPAKSGLIEFTKESVYTNNAGIQGAGSSPSGQYDGQPKNESGFTFTLESVVVPTIAHWVPASRQVLDDAPQLRNFIDGRLLYGLKLKEEDQFLNGDGVGGNIDGIVNQATQFNYGSTNLTKLDALAKGAMQLMLSDHEPTGIILNPRDWFEIILTKDADGRYLLGNPALMTEPRLWGLPVVATNTMDYGQFVVLDAPRAGHVADREDAIVRISESHDNFFVRNMVAILCEERSTIVIERPSAIVTGSLDYAG